MGIKGDMDEIEDYLLKKQADFDEISNMSRETIRGAGRAIMQLHNDNATDAKNTISNIKTIATKLNKVRPALMYYAVQALQEYAEASILYSIKLKKKIPTASELDILPEPYVLGMLDVVGELKREILESLRKENFDEAERYYSLMKEIYDSTAAMRFAEAILVGFRHKQDVARIQIEGAGSEILFARKRR